MKLPLTRLREAQGVLQTNLTFSTQSPWKERGNRSGKVRKSLTSVKVSLVLLALGIFIIYQGFGGKAVQEIFPKFPQFLRITSPSQDGLVISEPKNSPEGELVSNRKNLPKPEEKKEAPSVLPDEGKSSIANIRAKSGPSAALESLAISTQPSQIEIKKGESLSIVISKYYPKNQQIGLVAIMLANPEISEDYLIFAGQILKLPQFDPTDKIIKLQNNLCYSLYGRFYSVKELNKSKSWLNKNNIKYLVWNTKDAKKKAIHLVIFGGYEKKDDLKIALQIIKTKSE